METPQEEPESVSDAPRATEVKADEPLTDEINLEPLHLITESNAIMRMGQLMLSAGTGSYRIKEAMGRVARSLGIDEIDAQVNLSEIVATMRKGRIFRTQVVEMPVPGVNAHRIALLEDVSKRAHPGLTVAELHNQLDTVEATRRLYPHWMVWLAAAVACASFAFLNNGTWVECIAAGIAAGIGKLVQISFGRMRLNQLAVTFLAAAAACGAYIFQSLLFQYITNAPSPLHSSAFTSAALFLVPGFPLMTAALDLARLDFGAGIQKVFYALTIVLSASIGAWAIASISGLSPIAAHEPDIALGWLTALRVLTSFFGVLGFALTFNTPMKFALFAALIGGIVNPLRWAAVDLGLPVQMAAACATILVGLFAAYLSPRIHSPRITLSVPAVLIMIPGASAYRALVNFNNGNTLAALDNAFQAAVVVISLAIGLAIARMMTDREWTIQQPTWSKGPSTRHRMVGK